MRKCLIVVLWLVLSASVSEACQLYHDVIQDVKGNAIVGASVTIKVAGTPTLQTIYSDPLCATTIPNLVTDSTGTFEFWTNDVFVDIVPSKPGYTFATIENVPIFSPLGDNIVTVANYSTTDICATGTGAIDQIGSTAVTLVINKAVTCTLDKTIPTTLTLEFKAGGQITISSGKTLTINGFIYGGYSQLFAGSGTVKITNQDVNAAWWGTSHTAINAAIVANTANNAFRRVNLTPGYAYSLAGTINFLELNRGVLEGNGARLTWAGNSTDPMFLMDDVRDAIIRNLTIIASTTTPLAIGIKSQNGSGATISPTSNSYEHIVMEGTDGGLGKGWAFVGTGGGGDNNNAENFFYRTIVNNYTTAAYSFEHSQSKHHLLIGCQFAGNSTGARGIATSQGSGTQGGSFIALGCSGGGNSVADFDIGDSNDQISILGGTFENSARLLQTSGPSNSPFAITIQNVRWAVGTTLAANNRAVVYQFAGPLTMTGNIFEPYSANKALEIYYNPGGSVQGTFTALNNYFASTLTNPFTGLQPTIGDLNLIDRNDSNGAVKVGPVPTSFSNGDTTPSVQQGRFYKEANSGGTSITTFDDGYEGQEITILFTTGNTTLVNGATLILLNATNYTAVANETITLKKQGSAWYEVARGAGSTKTDIVQFYPAITYCQADDANPSLLRPTRVAANDWALARTAGGAETYNIICHVPAPTRTTSGKGFKMTAFKISQQITTAALTSNTFNALSTVTYANNTANVVAGYGGSITITMPTATQANPYLTSGTVGTPAFMNTANAQINMDFTVVMQNLGVYRLYGISVTWTEQE